ncbi:sialidase family protein [Reichenbachiella versicolor]|uniref:sialidase family protein n=1 Tax=Reichenbachiella versicolor TaxID=1821036 RepID=UPI0013A5ABF3|nr:sialidase family protein [Reichenbachiella versicolor]
MTTRILIGLIVLALAIGNSITALAQSPVDFSKMDKERIPSDPAVQWYQFGPGGAGNNYHIYWHSTDPNTAFLGPNMGNSYRTTDRGWTYDGIMDPDGPGYKSWNRGPVEIYSPEFSHQDENFGICAMENANYVYTTVNKGLNWKRRDDISAQFKDQHINTFEVDPTNDNIWYAGTGHVRDANHMFFNHKAPHGIFGSQRKVPLPGGGTVDFGHRGKIFKSIDKGETWKEITPKGIEPLAQITKIFVHPGNPKVIFAPSTYGFYKSKDGGKSWKLLAGTGLDNDIIRSADMHYDKRTGKVTLYAIDLVKYIPNGKSMSYNGGIYKSTDEGESWVNINANMPIKKDLLSSFFIKKGYYKYGLAKYFQIHEKEAMSLYPELPDEMLHSISVVRVNPSNPDHVMLVNNYKSQFTFPGGMLWRTDNGGKSWYVTLRNGKAWEGKDKALWEARNNPTAHNVSWVSQTEWENRDEYDRKAGASIEFNSDGSTIMYQVAKVVCISNDNGDTWLENDEQVATKGTENWVGSGNSNLPGNEIVQDLRLKKTIYFCSGENTIWTNTNDGGNIRSNGLAVRKLHSPNKEKPMECSVSSVIVDPEDDKTLYCVHNRQAFFGKVMKSTDAGETWAQHGVIFDPKKYGNPVGLIVPQQNLTIDPNNPNRFYISIPDKSVNDVTGRPPKSFDMHGVLRSMDGGKTWKNINDGLPNKKAVQKIGLDDQNKGAMYAAISGTNSKPGGLFQLKDGSDTWEKVNIPKGMVSVHDFYYSESDNRFYISGGTMKGKIQHGGVWYKEGTKDWQQVFPYQFTNNIRVSKTNPNVLLVSIPSKGTDMLNPGIYRSLDKGITWYKINSGNIQSDRLNDLDINYHKDGVYYSSTYGAGYYYAIDRKIIPEGDINSLGIN